MITVDQTMVDVAVTVASVIDPVALQSEGTANRGLTSLAVSGLFFLVGLVVVYGGFSEWKKKRLIEDTPTEKVRSLALGRTEVKGTAKATQGTVEQPFTDGEAVYADWEVEEYHADADDDGGGDWVTLDSGTAALPFDLDDGTGSVRVAATPDAAWEISDENRTRIKVGNDDSPPDRVRWFLENNSDVDVGREGFFFGERRRYTQQVLPPESDVYVFGQANDRANDGQDIVMERDSGSGRFIISDMDEAELESALTKRAPLLMGLGLLFSVGGLYGVLWSVGVA